MSLVFLDQINYPGWMSARISSLFCFPSIIWDVGLLLVILASDNRLRLRVCTSTLCLVAIDLTWLMECWRGPAVDHYYLPLDRQPRYQLRQDRSDVDYDSIESMDVKLVQVSSERRQA